MVCICLISVHKRGYHLGFRGRPFDILGGGGPGLFSQKKILALVLKEKNNLSLKRVKKKNLSLKRAKKK